MTERVNLNGLQVAKVLFKLVNEEILPGTGITSDDFWAYLAECITQFTPRNQALLKKRDDLQILIDDWHKTHAGKVHNPDLYKQFLINIGYLLPPVEPFTIGTRHVDPEISDIAGPQLVVPLTNARYALNATNARWGSLYDALYGTDVIPDDDGAQKGASYNPVRGTKVVEYVGRFLDEVSPLANGTYGQVKNYAVQNNQLLVTKSNGDTTTLAAPEQFAGYRGDPAQPSLILLHNHHLHIELHIDPQHPTGQRHPAGIKNVVLEAAVTTIQDLEDSVAVVDAQDKTHAYRNWLGLIKGDLSDEFMKNEKKQTRHLNADRDYLTPDGKPFSLPGRSLLLIRNVGHLLTNNAILDARGKGVFEGLLDAMITGLIGLHDLAGKTALRNSRAGSIYIVKPKMHGPDEVAFSDDLFAFVEEAFNLPPYTIKMGIMDEERRTSVNLKACIHAAKNRVVFINTGFLDRTGDEIHTSMEAGAMVPKAEMKNTTWINAYEDANVDAGLACGFMGKAQIGKGMWAIPDEMRKMVETKIGHPQAGANTAWVPSPTAAVLHAMHYHKVDVTKRQQELRKRPPADIDGMLSIPLLKHQLSKEEIEKELENNAHGVLGYVVRWINQGIGCSKVPDIHNIGLMEDRATLRISSQHIANWLHHGLCTPDQVMRILKHAAKEVDAQNSGDPSYRNMSPDFDDSIAFAAACDLIFEGREQPSGYTEPLLYKRRLEIKSRNN